MEKMYGGSLPYGSCSLSPSTHKLDRHIHSPAHSQDLQQISLFSLSTNEQTAEAPQPPNCCWKVLPPLEVVSVLEQHVESSLGDSLDRIFGTGSTLTRRRLREGEEDFPERSVVTLLLEEDVGHIGTLWK